MWPSAEMAEEIAKRLRERRRSHRDLHFSYDAAGHFIWIPHLPIGETHVYHPVLKESMEMGGTPQGNAFASWDPWAQLLKFLGETFNEK